MKKVKNLNRGLKVVIRELCDVANYMLEKCVCKSNKYTILNNKIFKHKLFLIHLVLIFHDDALK